ncbi:MAG: hypothetical protein L0H96_21535 [Humibacillus sp.]|nr:hypothetical protein [Humibacillus sp.]MDN5779479.1 hypothetical protein [Humibacillus sp.]
MIGLVFTFATFAGLVTIMTEAISRYMGLRAEYLLRGLRTLSGWRRQIRVPFWDAVTGRLVGDTRKTAAADPAGVPAAVSPFVTKVMTHPLILVTARDGNAPPDPGNAAHTNTQRQQLPAYLSSRSFAQALTDIIIPGNNGQTTIDQVRTAINAIPQNDLPPQLRTTLLALATGAANDVTAFRTNLEHWYDDQMARVSGWYKRHVRWISVVVGLVLVLAFNLNVLSIARSIYTDQALRGSVVTQATQAAQCGSKDPATCLADIRAKIDQVRGDGLPIGWAETQACSAPHKDCNWPEQKGLWGHGDQFTQAAANVLLLLLGWGLMVITLLPGARFWFDALSQLGSLRSTGPKPTTASTQA